METVLNVLHVVTAVFIIGPMAILPMSGLRAVRSGNGAQVATLAKSTFLFTLLSLLVVVFGFGAMGMADERFNLSFTTPWILYSIILYVIALILNLALVIPALRAAATQLHTVGGTGSDTVAATSGNSYPRIAIGSGVVAVLMVVIVILMVWKP